MVDKNLVSTLIRTRPSHDRGTQVAEPQSLHALSVDVEEFFQCEVFARCVAPSDWPRMASRVRPCLERLGTLLADHGARATFFVLGWCADRLRQDLQDLAAAGHEIACHGYQHQHLSRLDPAAFRDDVHRARDLLQDITGTPVTGYRAPTFSITARTAWALDVLLDLGFEYDASVFPIRHDRYGVPDAPYVPFWITAPSGRRLREYPPLTMNLGPLRLPLGGGGYLRLLPTTWIAAGLRRRAQRSQPTMLYVHPWELDPDQPRLPVGRLANWRHRVNLGKTAGKLAWLLGRFCFERVDRILARVPEDTLPSYTLGSAASA
jgi:polysaccharide deacetylase family protein (PEP-CTERM system associated)